MATVRIATSSSSLVAPSLFDDLHSKILERNASETNPYLSIHDANAALQHLIDSLQSKCDSLERDNNTQRVEIMAPQNKGNTALFKNEARLRDKLEKLQEELHVTLSGKSEDAAKALLAQAELSKMKDIHIEQSTTISNLTKENANSEASIQHLENECTEAKSGRNLAEQQYDGLKCTIRELQTENDTLTKENGILIDRVLTEKEKMSAEMNVWNEMVEKLKSELSMLRLLNQQETQRHNLNNKVGEANGGATVIATPPERNKPIKMGFFGKAFDVALSKSATKQLDPTPPTNKNAPRALASTITPTAPIITTNKWGSLGVTIPFAPLHSISTHPYEATCIRYDNDGGSYGENKNSKTHALLVTCGNDTTHNSTVKVWDSAAGGALKHTFRGASVIVACDLSGNFAAGAGSDKTCRVWNVTTNRMIHQLVGHSNKITCLKLMCSSSSSKHNINNDSPSVLTASADRSLKLWDIARSTYQQTTTFRYRSTANCLDVATGGRTTVGTSNSGYVCVSGHMDGSVQCWDARSGSSATCDMQKLHEGGVTSVQFNPTQGTQLLTNGKDDALKVIDVRVNKAIHVMKHVDFSTSFGYSSASFSPDGKYAAAGSSSTTGGVFIWRVLDGSFERKLSGGHTVSVCGLAWGRGGNSSGQAQLASMDRKGNMVLWA